MSPRRKRTAKTAKGVYEGMAMTVDGDRSARKANIRLAVVLAIVAAVFYFGIFVLKHS